uniref:Centrosomal protein of 97 kDa n=1 Tax=Phallusia mammillata TaxID=59560 RepID=A0A6F9DJ80_9ASCI|nr:uncharacterized protein LOC101242116 [Phallusia mammillata]
MLESGVLNLSNQFLSGDKLIAYLDEVKGESIHTLILDDNYLRKIMPGSLCVENVMQISLAKNQLTRTLNIQQFPCLRVLNLSSNLLMQLDGLNHLKYLEWISLSGNQLGNIDLLNSCTNLVHVDASDNEICGCPNLPNLKNLHTLLMQKNQLSDLQYFPDNIPKGIRILSLANNKITDLNQVKHLSSLPSLEQLSLAKNSCIDHSYMPTSTSLPSFNYRPFIINWCNNLSILDGIQVSQRENMKAEWLLSQGRGRAFDIGQHIELTEYLASVSPHVQYSYMVEDSDEEKIDKILEKKQKIDGKTSPMKKEDKSVSAPLELPKSRSQRIPEVEKRRRVQAWLGNTSHTPDTKLSKVRGQNYTAIHSKSHFDDDHSTDHERERKYSQSDIPMDDLNLHTNLLLSESEFVTGDDLPPPAVTPVKSSPHKSPLKSKSGGLSLIQKQYESPVTTSSSESTERWARRTLTSNMLEKPLPKPITCEHTPTLKQPITPAMLHIALNAGEMASPMLHDIDKSLSMSKYEEYEMRPIKPLNTDLQLKMYGATSTASPHASTKSRPPPLKKNSGVTSKHAVTGLRKSTSVSKEASTPMPRTSTKKQSNVTMKKTTIPIKKELSKVSKPSSPHRKRQQYSASNRELPNKSTTTKRKKTSEQPDHGSRHTDLVEENEDETTSNRSYTIRKHHHDRAGEPSNNSEYQPFAYTFPTDVKHVLAATKIQAAWRGFQARWKNPKVLQIRQELRYRRSEQYISLLCHELQMLKEKQEAEKRMRELQTEAIRFMWAQIRQLQQDQKTGSAGEKIKCQTCKSSHPKRQACDKRSSRSPRRSPKSSSPRSGHKVKQFKMSPRLKSRMADSESMLSSTCGGDTLVEYPTTSTQIKKADVSWRDDVDATIFHTTIDTTPVPTSVIVKEKFVEDTDEGRGSLTTDVEGIQTSDNDTKNSNKDDQELKSTVEQLQQQVLQLQCALLSFSDKLVNDDSTENMDTNNTSIFIPAIQNLATSIEDEDEVDTQVQPQEFSSDIRVESASPDMKKLVRIEDEEITSARDDAPKISLEAILTALDSALLEQELWSLCEQACLALKKKKQTIKYVATDTMHVRKDGMIRFQENIDPEKIDELFIAPEVVLSEKSEDNFKSSVFGLSVTLWSAADFQMKDEEAPSFSPEFESLLVAMSHDNCNERADIDFVLKTCEEYHSKTQRNSLEVCSSLFLEASDFRHQKKRELGSKLMQDVINSGRQQTKTNFVAHVAPTIRNFSFALKPVTERQLSPKPLCDLTPHENLMKEIQSGKELKKSAKPKVYTIRDMFEEDPSLLQKLNILPGQRRKNVKALQIALRRQQPSDPKSPPKSGIPTPPRALRAEIRNNPTLNTSDDATTNDNCSVILRWHPAHIYNKQGNEMPKEAIVGYRIYVNGQPKGMVAGTKTRALLDGLHRSCEYKIHVHAVAALGESDPSNVVIVYITQHQVVTQRSEVFSSPYQKETSKLHSQEAELANENKNNLTTSQPINPIPSNTKSSSNVPKPKVKICAVFPKQEVKNNEGKSPSTSPTIMQHGESATDKTGGSPLNNSSDSWTTAVSQDDRNKTVSRSPGSGDDIVDRVLRRYGIQKNVPPPAPVSSEKASQSQNTQQQAASTVSTDDETMQSFVSDSNNSQPSSASSADNITPRSKALLEQLKDELLM